ncbi:MAG: response regulator [Pseudomonadales bacterium]|nr:response regulator [Pseudomonadales bacterium]
MKWFQNLSIWFKVMSIALIGLSGFCLYLAFTYLASTDMQIQVSSGRRLDMPVMWDVAVIDKNLASLAGLYEQAGLTRSEAPLLQAQVLEHTLDAEMVTLLDYEPQLQERVRVALDEYRHYASFARAGAEAVVYGRLPGVQDIDPRTVEQLRTQLQTDLKGIQIQAFDLLKARMYSVEQQSRIVWVIGGTVGGLLAVLLLVVSTVIIKRLIVKPLHAAAEAANRIALGDFNVRLEAGSRDELGRLLQALIKMRDSLAQRFESDRRAEWVKTCVAELTTHIRGDLDEEAIASTVLNHLVPALHAQVGLLYVFQKDRLNLLGSHALVRRKNLSNSFRLGESLVGQAALERQQIVIEHLPDDYLVIASGMGESTPCQAVVTPIVHEGELRGVIEIGSLSVFSDDDLEILRLSVESIAIALSSAAARFALSEALEQQQAQARRMEDQQEQLREVNDDLESQAIQISASESKLQQQQEELRRAYTELEEQAQALRASEEGLQAQQEELRVINEELEEQAKLLAEQRNELLQKNEQLERTGELMEEKNRLLEQSSRYKSEFLSTMSHELRTPLNSILILSNALAENKQGNLGTKQIEHAQVIHSAGSDLLTLINDILDIAKVEEGKMQLVIEKLPIVEMAEDQRRCFSTVANHRGLTFEVKIDAGVPEAIYTDRQRLEQILRNFFSNAFKFTHHGGVTLHIHRPAEGVKFRRMELDPGQVVAFSCVDTGIGVPLVKQELIFEAFQQADGTTSRKYGGTGLGLTISRELSHLLGGEVQLHSDGEAMGSTFTLYLPVGQEVVPGTEEETKADEEQPDRNSPILPKRIHDERTLLVVDDDAGFANVVADLAREYRFKALVAHDGETGVVMAREFQPDAIILDLGLPGIDGLEVMRQLKADPVTKAIPVHFFSGRDEKEKALGLGAQDYLLKPVNLQQIQSTFEKLQSSTSRPFRRLLVVEDSSIQHDAIVELFAEHQVEVSICGSGGEAQKRLAQDSFDCMILDLSLPDMDGFSLLETLHSDDRLKDLPIIVYTGRDLSREEEARLRKHADRIILKTERSAERLLSEVSLFLHWVDSQGASRLQNQASLHRDDVFSGRRILVVDDDMRNIYALSASLEEWGCDITVANNGREAIKALQEAKFDLVLMDIMMPEMDGYEAMRRIREMEHLKQLPILALTAKAMKEDRSKCLEAGANDYISKPISLDKLQSLMRVWLHPGQ